MVSYFLFKDEVEETVLFNEWADFFAKTPIFKAILRAIDKVVVLGV
jgi:hypothetical protein